MMLCHSKMGMMSQKGSGLHCEGSHEPLVDNIPECIVIRMSCVNEKILQKRNENRYQPVGPFWTLSDPTHALAPAPVPKVRVFLKQASTAGLRNTCSGFISVLRTSTEIDLNAERSLCMRALTSGSAR